MLAAQQRDFCVYLADDQHSDLPGIADAAQRGLPVYHYAYRATLVACLRDTFEKTLAWLGDTDFDAAACAYVTANPSTSWTLAGYGADFDRTLATLYPNDPEVADLAWLDRALRSAFDGPDGAPLDQTTLGDVDWEQAVFDIVPTLTFHDITSNAPAIWSAIAAGEEPPAASALPIPVILSVWRHELVPQFLTLSTADYVALDLAKRGATFPQMCAAAFPGDEDAAEVGAMLGRWISEGIVTGVSSAATPSLRSE